MKRHHFKLKFYFNFHLQCCFFARVIFPLYIFCTLIVFLVVGGGGKAFLVKAEQEREVVVVGKLLR